MLDAEKLSRIKKLENLLKCRFKNVLLFVEALTHRSVLSQTPSWPYRDNEALEFLGDAILSAIISHILWEKYSQGYREGDLSKMRAWLVKEKQLAKLAQKYEIDKIIFLGEGEEKTGGRKKPSILAGALEAIIGALYLDQGYRKTYSLVRKLFAKIVSQAPKGLKTDFKTRLQEFTQQHYKILPQYEVLKEEGPQHAKTFWVGIKIDSQIIAQARGGSKKEAEQKAAKKALKKLGG